MKNKLFAYIAIGIYAVLMASCNNTTKELESLNKKVLKNAIANQDLATAISAASNLYAIDTLNNAYIDTLANLYYNAGNFNAAYNMALRNSDTTSNVHLLKLLAYSAKKANRFTDAIFHFQDLIKADAQGEMLYKFEIGLCYFAISNLESAVSYMNEVAANPASFQLKYRLDGEEVTYNAAAINTIGFCLIEKKDYAEAEKLYAMLLQRYPDFVLAQNNYKYLQQQVKSSQ